MASSPQTDAAHEAAAVVEIHEVVREYLVGDQRVRALDGVDLSLRAGEIVAVVGPSGSGKSTLLHIIGALDNPTSGAVSVNGVDITNKSESAQADFRLRNIGFVFQSFNLIPNLLVWENVALPRLFGGESLRSAKADAVDLLTKVGLADRVDHRPHQLSGGQIQRVAIARALIMKPPIILADEPTGNLDSKSSGEIMSLLKELSDTGATSVVVIVTHDMAIAEAFANRVVAVRDGAIESDSVAVSSR